MTLTTLTLAAVAALTMSTPAVARQAAPPAQQAEAKAPTDPKLAASYVGQWTLDIQSPQGPLQSSLEVKIDAQNKVTGTMSTPQGNSAIGGEFKDAVLAFAISFDAGGTMIDIWFESTIKDGRLAGTMSLGDMGSYPFTGVRAK